MRIAVFALAAVLFAFAALLPAVSARAADGPDAVIAAIYKRAAAGKGEDGGNFVYQEPKDRGRWLTKSLAGSTPVKK